MLLVLAEGVEMDTWAVQGGMNRSFTDRLSGWVAPWGQRRVLLASSNTAAST